MPLVTTPGAVDATSYSSLADALVRAALDVRATAFLAVAADTTQEALLAMATSDIDAALLSTGRLRGVKASETQALELPRAGSSVLPVNLVRATQLMAFHLAERLELNEIGTAIADTSNVKEDTTGPLTTVYFEPKTATLTAFEQLPVHVRGHLESLLQSATANYGTGTAVRGS